MPKSSLCWASVLRRPHPDGRSPSLSTLCSRPWIRRLPNPEEELSTRTIRPPFAAGQYVDGHAARVGDGVAVRLVQAHVHGHAGKVDTSSAGVQTKCRFITCGTAKMYRSDVAHTAPSRHPVTSPTTTLHPFLLGPGEHTEGRVATGKMVDAWRGVSTEKAGAESKGGKTLGARGSSTKAWHPVTVASLPSPPTDTPTPPFVRSPNRGVASHAVEASRGSTAPAGISGRTQRLRKWLRNGKAIAIK